MFGTADAHGFIKWFKLNKTLAVKNHMSRPIRVECELGCPPQPFTTKASKGTMQGKLRSLVANV